MSKVNFSTDLTYCLVMLLSIPITSEMLRTGVAIIGKREKGFVQHDFTTYHLFFLQAYLSFLNS